VHQRYPTEKVNLLDLDASEAEDRAAKEAKKRGRRDFDKFSRVEIESTRFDSFDRMYTIEGHTEGEVEEGRILKKDISAMRSFEAQVDAKTGKVRGFRWVSQESE
jgi:hypothetical protein